MPCCGSNLHHHCLQKWREWEKHADQHYTDRVVRTTCECGSSDLDSHDFEYMFKVTGLDNYATIKGQIKDARESLSDFIGPNQWQHEPQPEAPAGYRYEDEKDPELNTLLPDNDKQMWRIYRDGDPYFWIDPSTRGPKKRNPYATTLNPRELKKWNEYEQDFLDRMDPEGTTGGVRV